MLELCNTNPSGVDFNILGFEDYRVFLLGVNLFFPHWGLLSFSFPKELHQLPK